MALNIENQEVEALLDELQGFRRFGKGRHPAGPNYGDLFAHALARAFDEALLFKGDDFAKTDLRSAVVATTSPA